MLIKGWEKTKILCEKENNTQKKQNFCIEQYQFQLALKTKGLCKGAHTLKLENDTKRDNQLYKDQYKVFEKTVRNKWVPCMFFGFKYQRVPWIVIDFSLNINECLHLSLFFNWKSTIFMGANWK